MEKDMGKEKEVITGSDQPGWWEEQIRKGREDYRDSMKSFVDAIAFKNEAENSHGLSDRQKEECMRIIEAREKGYELGVFKGRRGNRLMMRKVYDSMAGVVATGGPVVKKETWKEVVMNGRSMTRKFEQKWLKSKKV